MGRPEDHVLASARTIQRRLDELYEAVDGSPEPGSALDQAGLRDGLDIVEEYLRHGELGIAVEHVVYMVVESELELPKSELHALASLCSAHGVEVDGWPAPADGDSRCRTADPP